MPDYLVVWKLDVEAESPHEAARKALAIQRNPKSVTTVFEVCEKPVHYDVSDWVLPEAPQ